MPGETQKDRFLTLSHVAEVLNVSVRYVRTLRQSGALPVVPLSPRCLRVRRCDLDRMVEERMAGRRSRKASRLRPGQCESLRFRSARAAWATTSAPPAITMAEIQYRSARNPIPSS